MEKDIYKIKETIKSMEKLELELLVLLKISDELRYGSLEKLKQYVEDRMASIDIEITNGTRVITRIASDVNEMEMENIREIMRELQKKVGV